MAPPPAKRCHDVLMSPTPAASARCSIRRSCSITAQGRCARPGWMPSRTSRTSAETGPPTVVANNSPSADTQKLLDGIIVLLPGAKFSPMPALKPPAATAQQLDRAQQHDRDGDEQRRRRGDRGTNLLAHALEHLQRQGPLPRPGEEDCRHEF